MNILDGISSLDIIRCNSVDDAISKGYTKEAKYESAKNVVLSTAVIVSNGTVQGNDTVDLILHDAEGNTYIAMVTKALLKHVTCNL